MKFDELDAKMRVFETAHDHQVLPGLYMVARVEGRSFSRLTKERHDVEAPFDERFRDMMIETTRHLMEGTGMRMVYGYTESDEISVLLHPADTSFGRKLRKLNSVLAGEASAKLTHLLGDLAVFDCRVSQLPTPAVVVDYFRWRSEDAHRNCLNAHCYWMLRREGEGPREATAQIEGLSIAAKNELLFSRGLNFNELPRWQRRGTGLSWESYEKTGENPRTGQETIATRRRLSTNMELPMGDAYSRYVAALVPDLG